MKPAIDKQTLEGKIRMAFGFIDSIRNFFVKNQHIDIYYADLDKFLKEKHDAISHQIEGSAKDEISALNEIIKAANTSIVAISQKRPDESLEEAERDKVRDAIVDYVNETRKVLKFFVFFEDEPARLVEILESCDPVIDEYERKIKPDKEILSVQFKEDMDSCEKEYMRFKDKLSEISRRLSKDRLKKIERISELSKKISDIEAKKTELSQKKALMNENLEKINEVKEKHLSKIDEFKMSPDFSKFHETLAKKKIVMDKLAEHKDMFEHDFEKLKPAIIYYQSRYFKNVFNKYLEEPYESFLDDEGEKFADALPDLKEKVAAGEIPIDPDKKKACIETVNKFTRQYAQSQIDEYKDLKEDKFKYDRLLSSNKIMSDYTELEYKIDHINNKLKDQKEILREVVSELTSLDSEKLILEAETRLNEEFGSKFSIYTDRNQKDGKPSSVLKKQEPVEKPKAKVQFDEDEDDF